MGESPGTSEECSIERYGAFAAEVMQTVGLPPAVLVGHSMGAGRHRCRIADTRQTLPAWCSLTAASSHSPLPWKPCSGTIRCAQRLRDRVIAEKREAAVLRH